MQCQSLVVESLEEKSAQRAHARDGYVTLAILKSSPEIDNSRVERHALTLVHGDSPRKPQRYLRDGREDLVAVHYLPHFRLWSKRAIFGLHNRLAERCKSCHFSE